MDGGEKKKLWIVANWKSNKTISEALDWVSKVGPSIPKDQDSKVIVCPTFSILEEVSKAVQVGSFPLSVGSQDLSPFDLGSYTGEEPASLLNMFASYAILGHSERRQNFNETDELVARKVSQAVDHKITPIVCVQGVDTPLPEGTALVAYEPTFAIGTGNPDTPDNANNVAKVLKQKYGPSLMVLYGGSVTKDNIKGFINQENINGVLVGRASLDADEFIGIIKNSLER